MRLQPFPSVRSPAIRAVLISACVLGAATAVVFASQVRQVLRPKAEVQDIKGSAGDVIETVPKNANLEDLGHEGPWVKVRTPGGKVGYVSDAVFQAGGGGSDLSGVTGSATATPTEASAAGRGWDPEVTSYISSKRINPAGLKGMEDARDAYRGLPLRTFQKNGKVGAK